MMNAWTLEHVSKACHQADVKERNPTWLIAPVAFPASTVSALVCESLQPLQEICDTE